MTHHHTPEELNPQQNSCENLSKHVLYMQAHLLLNKRYTKVVPERAMKGSKVSGGTTPLTLNLGTRQVKKWNWFQQHSCSAKKVIKMDIILFLFIELSSRQHAHGSVFCGRYISTLPCTTAITARHAVKQTDAQHSSDHTNTVSVILYCNNILND
jgi:hypothetical protein